MSSDKPSGLPNDLFPAPSMPNYGAIGTDDLIAENDVKVVGEPVFSTGSGLALTEPICTTCEHYWRMEITAPIKNLKEDGTPYKMKEDYCMATGFGLVSLAERAVITCTKHMEKVL